MQSKFIIRLVEFINCINMFELEKDIFSFSALTAFNDVCIKVFQYQYQNNKIYQKWLKLLGVEEDAVRSFEQISFMPISFFKFHKIISGNFSVEKVFRSSRTTGDTASQHFVCKLSVYEESFLKSFQKFYGSIDDYCILALLPGYLERDDSSLVYMTNILIQQSQYAGSGFYLKYNDDLFRAAKCAEKDNKKILLLGVTYALLDLPDDFVFKNMIVMETGGMKGKRKEMIKQELHEVLKKKYNVDAIHAEYGMTELLSQAYSKGHGRYYCPPWMKILITDVNQPQQLLPLEKTGRINVIDLANIYSCAFIATDDLGKVYPDGGFEILGRADNSETRGCNLMIQ